MASDRVYSLPQGYQDQPKLMVAEDSVPGLEEKSALPDDSSKERERISITNV